MIVENSWSAFELDRLEGVDTNWSGLSTGLKNLRDTAATCVRWSLALRRSTAPSANQNACGSTLMCLSLSKEPILLRHLLPKFAKARAYVLGFYVVPVSPERAESFRAWIYSYGSALKELQS